MQVVGIPVGIPGEIAGAVAMELSRCPYHLASSTLPMPALAGVRQVIDGHTLPMGAAIFAALYRRAIATWMCALLGFLFGH